MLSSEPYLALFMTQAEIFLCEVDGMYGVDIDHTIHTVYIRNDGTQTRSGSAFTPASLAIVLTGIV